MGNLSEDLAAHIAAHYRTRKAFSSFSGISEVALRKLLHDPGVRPAAKTLVRLATAIDHNFVRKHFPYVSDLPLLCRIIDQGHTLESYAQALGISRIRLEQYVYGFKDLALPATILASNPPPPPCRRKTRTEPVPKAPPAPIDRATLRAEIAKNGETVAGVAAALRISTETLEGILKGGTLPALIAAEICQIFGRSDAELGIGFASQRKLSGNGRAGCRRRSRAERNSLSLEVHRTAVEALLILHIKLRHGLVEVPWPTRPPDHAPIQQIEWEFRNAWSRGAANNPLHDKRCKNKAKG